MYRFDQTVERSAARSAGSNGACFRHEALLYKGVDDFVDRTVSFLADGIAGSEPALVIVSAEKADLLRSALGSNAPGVSFADVDEFGGNPARLIPRWQLFVAENAGRARRFRGVGEPISRTMDPDALVECHRNEALLNLAFDGPPAWWLVCLYDAEVLAPEVIDAAARTHPCLIEHGSRRPSDRYIDLDPEVAPFDSPLTEPPPNAEVVRFAIDDLAVIRWFVWDRATTGGFSDGRAADLVLAVNEIATNSLRHATGSGVLRVWIADHELICEITDQGHIDAPLAGRLRPARGQGSGYGLWLANQLCDLVQIRSFDHGSAVRIHMTVD